ncbi:DUF6266 family protein [Pedobacter deserti]|uniref:DUF6266 family protein n=1 Tax=Pedobacter deserti TaxID=2817382 RepID=UPI00210EBD76|nr:DUF6266 family protein [Pedobacter sp. SYSU D00382]
MGKLSRGFLGGFQGQLGTAYGCFWRLMDLIKAMPRKSNRPPTVKQIEVQLKMKLVSGFLSWAKSIIKPGFDLVRKPNQSAMNACVAYNLEVAVAGVSPNYTIDFAQIRFSEGKLGQLSAVQVAADNEAELNFSWAADLPGLPDRDATDRVSVIVFNPAKDRFVIAQDVVARSAVAYDMSLPLDFSGDEVQVYILAKAVDGRLVSRSQYLGELIIV